MLARREHSRVELMQKLLDREFDSALCVQQLDHFKQQNWQSDTRYAESFVRSCFIKGKGPQIIKQHLQQHEIDRALVNKLISSEDYDWFEAAISVRIKKFGTEIPKEFADKQKQMRFLQYRGFSHEQIKEAFV